MTHRSFAAGLAALLVFAINPLAWSDVPRNLSYQGRLPSLGTTTASITVNLYDASSGGTLLFSETHAAVPLTNGVFSINIGSQTVNGIPLTALGALPVWLGVSVNGAAELTPRTRLQSVPFAFKALGAENLIVPGTFTNAAKALSDGNVIFEDRVEIGAATDGGALIQLRNVSDVRTINLDGADSADSGGRVEIFNGASTNVATLTLDGNDGSDSRVDFFDAGGFDAIRLHSDLTNGAPEVSLFVASSTQPLRETVQIQANFDADSSGAGEIRLRRVDPTTQAATTTVQLAATGDSVLGLPNDGGQLVLSHSDGNPVFTVHAGDGASALSPTWMELRNANDVRRMHATTTALNYFDINDNRTIFMSGATGDVTFNGNATIGGDATVAGEMSVGVLIIAGGSDLSERFDVRGDASAIEPGSVVCIDPANPGALLVSQRAYDRTVAGVMSGAGGVKPGMLMSQSGTLADGKHAVALTGRVWVKCDTTHAAIEPGDLLTTSDTPGHAMRVDSHERASGACIGKAMTHLAKGERGLVLVLVNLQ